MTDTVSQRTSPWSAIASGLRSYWVDAAPGERLGYSVGGLLMASGLFHLGVFLVDGGAWQGPLSWRKPVTFGLSFGLKLVTITWLTTFLRLSGRWRCWLLTVFAIVNIVEVGLVTMQAWRGVPSHFNDTTSFDSAVFVAMGVSVAVIAAVVVAATALAFLAPATTPSMSWAIRAGLAALLVSQAVGGLMIAEGFEEVRAGDQAGAYSAGAMLKPAHAATLHAVQVLPILAWSLSFVAWTERARLRLVGAGVAGYLLLTGSVVAQTLADEPPLTTGLPAGGLLGAGALLLFGAVAAALLDLAAGPGARGLHRVPT